MAEGSPSGVSYTKTAQPARRPSSAFCQPPRAKTTLSAVTGIPEQDKLLIFASEWVFKPEGVKAVKSRFERVLHERKLLANHMWDRENKVFCVRCIAGDTAKVSFIFNKILQDEIKEPHGNHWVSDDEDGSDVMVEDSDGEVQRFVSNKIERLSIWNQRNGIAELESNYLNFPHTVEVLNPIPIKEYPVDIRFYAAKAVWICPEVYCLDDVVPDDTLTALKKLTGCAFAKNLNERKIYIGHPSETSCQLAIAKLNVILKYSNSGQEYLAHVFYTEEIRDYQLRLCRYGDMKKKYFETTLLHPFQVVPQLSYGKLHFAATVRCAQWNSASSMYMPLRLGKFVPASNKVDVYAGSRDFSNFTYNSKGSDDSNPMRHFKEHGPQANHAKNAPQIYPPEKSNIVGWAQQVSCAPSMNDLASVDEDSIRSTLNTPLEGIWECPKCTLHNPFCYLACDACAFERPAEIITSIAEQAQRNAESRQSTVTENNTSIQDEDPDDLYYSSPPKRQANRMGESILFGIPSANNSTARKNGESQWDNYSAPRPAWDTYVPYDPEVVIKPKIETAHFPTAALQRNVAAARLAADKRVLRSPKIVPGNVPVSPPTKNPSLITDPRRAASAPATNTATSSPTAFPPAALPKPAPRIRANQEKEAAKDMASAQEFSNTAAIPTETPESVTKSNALAGSSNHPLIEPEFPGDDPIWLGPPTARSMLEEDIPVLEFDALEPTRNISSVVLSSQIRSSSALVIAPSAISKLDGNDEQAPTSTQEVLDETVQDNLEPSTRTFHCTMGQMAPKPNANRNKKHIYKPGQSRGRFETPTVPPIQFDPSQTPRQNQAAPISARKGHGLKPGQFAGRLPMPDTPSPSRAGPSQPLRSSEPSKQSPATSSLLNPVDDPIPEFTSVMNASLERMADIMRGFRGEVVIQAEFGRLILAHIPDNLIPSLDSLQSSPEADMRALLLPNLQDPTKSTGVFFSPVITTLSTDVNYLVDMKNHAGEAMWEQNTCSWSVIYEIICHDETIPGANGFSVEINGETFNTHIKTRHHFGAINVSGTRRHWDFRVAAFGFGNEESNDRLYGDFARAIQKSLYIPPSLAMPSLLFELDDSFERDSGFVIDHILVYRITNHKSIERVGTEPKSILKISEIRALDIDSQQPNPESVFRVYRATTGAHRLGIYGLDFWHEVSISSTKANELFVQNESLELGNEVSWTADELSRVNAAEAIYMPACEMLRKMDGVGLHNDNGVDLLMTPPVSEIGYKPAKTYSFW